MQQSRMLALVPPDLHTYYVIAPVEPGPKWWEASAPIALCQERMICLDCVNLASLTRA